MRFATISDRLSLITASDTVIDIARASGGWFSPNIQDAYEHWDELLEFCPTVTAEGTPLSDFPVTEFGNPAPNPRQLFAIGLNYADHAAESSLGVPAEPPVFTKFVTSLADPYGTVTLVPGKVDWEVELVVVLGRRAHRVAATDAWSYVAGVTVGQDISERVRQRVGPAAQFSMGKSFPGFGPIGPVLVTPDEFDDPDDLELGCLINGEQMQQGRTSDMVFPVTELIARLSAITPLLPGDVIFTGTPAGVGFGRTPQRYLAPGDELVSYVRGVGEMRHLIVAGQ
ncbi:fumarylacetoacetate hydrolase family protein [Nocardia brasiliensis NBRC 14402]|uniref:fumarylacetoacetate hydrolase family protein n=1 Tax=Nocardia brasiliensis TaxID=37326 RepID=UPI0003140874|nr:fumarylacetoacetate hydrolase family protein [Nocardia brasiliensis]ASF11183.1 fumarylacetoacetate hydrolase [Nocardia brasiliensis]GAJ84274.1 fumarylacetoacetate hydrolase family protein [Nocardia brasiliensis NBRC 14402]SUB10112.1 Ureidoglycolate lyase [Nocardia brasiliensis]